MGFEEYQLNIDEFGSISADSFSTDCKACEDHNHQLYPCHEAATKGNLVVLEKIIRLAGTFEMERSDEIKDLTPMHFAAKEGRDKAIELMFRMGSPAMDTPSDKTDGHDPQETHPCWTPMHIAAENGHTTTIETLMRLGSGAIDRPSSKGWTPMHLAAAKRQVNAIMTLARFGSLALDVHNEKGQTPLDVAISGRPGNFRGWGARETNKWIVLRHTDNKEHGYKEKFTSTYSSSECIEVLRRLGAKKFSSNGDFIPELQHPLDEEKTINLRFQVYFSVPLAQRLLFELERTANNPQLTTQRRLPAPRELEAFPEEDSGEDSEDVDSMYEEVQATPQQRSTGRLIVIEGFPSTDTSPVAARLSVELDAELINSQSLPLVSATFGGADLRQHFERQSPEVRLHYAQFYTSLASEHAKMVVGSGRDVVMDGYWPRVVASCANENPMVDRLDNYPPGLLKPDALILLTKGEPDWIWKQCKGGRRKKVVFPTQEAYRRFGCREVNITDLDEEAVFRAVLDQI